MVAARLAHKGHTSDPVQVGVESLVASERLVSLGTGDDAPKKSCKLLSMRWSVYRRGLVQGSSNFRARRLSRNRRVAGFVLVARR